MNIFARKQSEDIIAPVQDRLKDTQDAVDSH